MTLDFIVAAIIVVMAGLGGIVSAHAPSNRKHKWLYGIAFGLLAVTALVLTWMQTSRVESDQRKLKEQIAVLTNASLIQATTDDIRAVRGDINSGFDQMTKAIGSLGAKIPPKTVVPSSETHPPAVVQHIQLSQKRVPSTKDGTPYGLQVILQTDVTQQPTGFVIECDGEIAEGDFFVAGQPAMMNVRYGVNKNSFYFSFGYPPFTPESPIVVTLLSKNPIRVTKVARAAQ